MTYTPAMAASPYSIATMTFGEIEAIIKKKPAVILPLGVIEPCAEYGALGAASLVCFALANALSVKKSILLAPMEVYGYSAAYKAFAGCAAVSKNTLAALLYDLMRSWTGQGIRAIIVIDGTFDGAAPVEAATKRLHASKRGVCCVLNWQHNRAVRSFIAGHCNGDEYGKSEFGLLSMTAHIDAGYVRPARPDGQRPLIADQKDFQRWRRMGRDPEKFRKLFPSGRTSPIAAEYSAEFGKDLFSYISAVFEATVASELSV